MTVWITRIICNRKLTRSKHFWFRAKQKQLAALLDQRWCVYTASQNRSPGPRQWAHFSGSLGMLCALTLNTEVKLTGRSTKCPRYRHSISTASSAESFDRTLTGLFRRVRETSGRGWWGRLDSPNYVAQCRISCLPQVTRKKKWDTGVIKD